MLRPAIGLSVGCSSCLNTHRLRNAIKMNGVPRTEENRGLTTGGDKNVAPTAGGVCFVVRNEVWSFVGC